MKFKNLLKIFQRRWFFWSGTATLIFTSLILALWLFLLSPTGTNYIVSHLKSFFYRLDYGLVTWKPSRKFGAALSISDLDLEWRASGQILKLKTKRLDLSFDFSWPGRLLTIESLILSDTEVENHLYPPDPAAEKSTVKSPALFFAPPVKIDLHNCEINNLKLTQENHESQLKLTTEHATLKLMAKIRPEDLETSLDLILPDSTTLERISKENFDSKSATPFYTRLALNTGLDLKITTTSGDLLKKEVNLKSLKLKLTDTELRPYPNHPSRSTKPYPTRVPPSELTITGQLVLETPEFSEFTPQFLKEVSVKTSLRSGIFKVSEAASFEQLDLRAQITKKINEPLNLNYELQLDGPKSSALQKYPLKRIGLNGQLTFATPGDFEHFLDEFKLTSDFSLAVTPVSGLPVEWEGSLPITLRISKTGAMFTGDLTLNLPPTTLRSAESKPLIRWQAGKIILQTFLDDLQNRSGSFELLTQFDGLAAPSLTNKLKMPDLKAIDRIELKTNGKFSNQTLLIPHFQLATSGGELNVNGNLHWDPAQTQSEGKLVVGFDRGIGKFMDLTLGGILTIPWTIHLRNKTSEVFLDTQLQLKQFSFTAGATQIKEVNGIIPIREALKLKGGRPEFLHLSKYDPFKRVDFDRLHPLMLQNPFLRINEIRFEDKSYGPLATVLGVEQNLLTANDLRFDLRAGTIAGELNFDFAPQQLQLGLLSRVNDLKLGAVLPKRLRRVEGEESKQISARTALNVNIGTRLIEGRIDITQIGADQLITLINALDPNYEDNQLNKIRKALAIANPTLIELELKQGFMNLHLKLSGAVSMNFDVRSIPISHFVASTLSEIQGPKGKH